MTTIWNDLLNLFDPRLCQLCKKTLLPEERELCLHCLCDLPRTYYHRRDDHPLLPIFAGISSFRHVTAFLFYREGGCVQSLIHSFKYRGNKQLAERLGRMAALELQADGFFRDVEVCVPVPLYSIHFYSLQNRQNPTNTCGKTPLFFLCCPLHSEIGRAHV